MTDRLVSLLRTAIPALWGTVVAWLVSTGILAPHAAAGVQAELTAATTPIAIGVVYLLARLVEPHLPPWLTRIILGSNTQPTYRPSSGDVAETTQGRG